MRTYEPARTYGVSPNRMAEHSDGAWVRRTEAEAAIEAARAEVPAEIAAVVHVAGEVCTSHGMLEGPGCDCPACRIVRVFRALTPAQRKACGLSGKS